jgi:pyruvate/2-oxoglutarate dehydrogenase complex dihydrolipoamide dehydrogenase (E3) component
MTRYTYDLVVVGAGSGGFAAARTARDLGASVALVDKGPLGGLCILRGCMPSKSVLASSDAAYEARDAVRLGVRAPNVTVDAPFVIRRKRELVREFADYRIAGIKEFPLYEGRARFTSPLELEVGDVALEGKKFVVATGSVIAPPPVPGLAEAGYVDSDAALELERIPASLIVLGGGYVACELGQYFARMGAKVTMVFRAPHLLSRADDDIGNALTGYFREEGIDVVNHATMMSVSARGGKKYVRVLVDGVEGEIEADEIFHALGRVPDIADLGLENAGVDAHNVTGISVDDTLRTSNENIFAIGDVSGLYQLVHVAIYQGQIAARNAIRGAGERADYSLMRANTVFSDPQVAECGMTERELVAGNVPHVRGSYDFAEHGKAMALGKTRGFVKMMADPGDGKILGAAVIGPQASELIHEVIVAMTYGATVGQFARIPHLHPTLAEIWTYPAEDCAAALAAQRVATSGTAR